MADRYSINFDKTFGSAMLLGVEPKMTRADKQNPKSEQVQARDANGTPKWTVTLAVQTKSFDNTKFETIQVAIVSPNKPYEAIMPGTPVTAEDTWVGIMPQQRGGFSVFYSAEAIRPIQPAQSSRLSSAQPQPARVAVGQ
jgi:hypothetical protein